MVLCVPLSPVRRHSRHGQPTGRCVIMFRADCTEGTEQMEASDDVALLTHTVIMAWQPCPAERGAEAEGIAPSVDRGGRVAQLASNA